MPSAQAQGAREPSATTTPIQPDPTPIKRGILAGLMKIFNSDRAVHSDAFETFQAEWRGKIESGKRKDSEGA